MSLVRAQQGEPTKNHPNGWFFHWLLLLTHISGIWDQPSCKRSDAETVKSWCCGVVCEANYSNRAPAGGAIESLENLVFSRLFLIFCWFGLSEPTIFLEVKIRRFLLHPTLGAECFRTEPRIFDNDFVGVFVVWIATVFSCLKQILSKIWKLEKL